MLFFQRKLLKNILENFVFLDCDSKACDRDGCWLLVYFIPSIYFIVHLYSTEAQRIFLRKTLEALIGGKAG